MVANRSTSSGGDLLKLGIARSAIVGLQFALVPRHANASRSNLRARRPSRAAAQPRGRTRRADGRRGAGMTRVHVAVPGGRRRWVHRTVVATPPAQRATTPGGPTAAAQI